MGVYDTMMIYLLAHEIKSPKPKPMIRIPDSVMTPYNAQVFTILIKCQETLCIVIFIFSNYIENISVLYLVRQLYSFHLGFGLYIYQQQ